MSVFIIWWWWSMQHPVFCCFRLMDKQQQWWCPMMIFDLLSLFVVFRFSSLFLSLSLNLSLSMIFLSHFHFFFSIMIWIFVWNNNNGTIPETNMEKPLFFFVFAVFFVIKIYKILGYNFLFVFFSFSGRNGFG